MPDAILSITYSNEHCRVYLSLANGTVATLLPGRLQAASELDPASSAFLGDDMMQSMLDDETAVEDRFEIVDPIQRPPPRPLLGSSSISSRSVGSILCVGDTLWCGVHGAVVVLDALDFTEVSPSCPPPHSP
jgi:hypothetical protein